VTEHTRLMIRVLDRRETRTRLTLSRLTREVAQKRAAIQALDKLISAVRTRMRVVCDARYSNGPRTVAALTELEDHTRALRDQSEQLQQLRRRAQHGLDELVARQRSAAQQWRRSEARLGHVESLARRERIARFARGCELDDEAYTERQSAAGSTQ